MFLKFCEEFGLQLPQQSENCEIHSKTKNITTYGIKNYLELTTRINS